MNFSLSSLVLSSYGRSPFFSRVAESSKGSFEFSKLSAKSFFSNFFFGKSFNSNLKFSKSKFSMFLDTPIKLVNEEFLGKNFSQRISPEKCENTFIVKNCYFGNCTTDESGGAIFVSCEKQINVISNSRFLFCFSKNKNCGALSISSSKSTAITGCCFSKCAAIIQFSAFEIKVLGKCAFNLSAISECGGCADRSLTGTEHNFKDLFRITGGIQKIEYVNISRNLVYSGSAGFSAFSPIRGTYTFISIVRNSGGFAFERVKMADDVETISHISIFHHRAPMCGTMHLQIYAKMFNFSVLNVTLDPFIYAEDDSLMIMEDSTFDCSINSIRVKFPRGYTNQFMQNKDCIFDEKFFTIITFNVTSNEQCFAPEKEVKPGFITTAWYFIYTHPHIFGAFLIVSFFIVIIISIILSRREENVVDEIGDDINELKPIKLQE